MGAVPRSGELLRVVSLALLVGAPLAYLQSVGEGVQLALLFAAVPLGVLASGFRLAAGWPLVMPAGGVWIAAALVAFHGLASRSWADFPRFAGPPAFLHIQLLFAVLLLPQLVRGPVELARLASGYLAVAVLLAGGFLAGCALGGDTPRGQGFGWPAGNPNLAAILVEPAALLAVAALAMRPGALRLAAAALLCAALVASRSLGALLALGTGLVALSVLLPAVLLRPRALLAVGLALVLGAAGGRWVRLAPAATPPPPGAPAAPAAESATTGLRRSIERSLTLRGLLARQALDTWAATPRRWWLGCGLGGYLPAAIPHRPLEYAAQPERSASSDHPHNTFLLRLAEQGAVGLVLYLALLAVLLRRGLALVRRGGASAPIGATGLAALAGLLAHGQVERFLDDPLPAMWWACWAGVLAGPHEEPPPREEPQRAAGLAFGVVPSIALATVFQLYVALPLSGRLDALAARSAAADLATARDELSRRALRERIASLRERAVAALARPGESSRSLLEREHWALACHAAGQHALALAILDDVEARCPAFTTIEWRMASLALRIAVERADLAALDRSRRDFARFFARCPAELGAYQEWWHHRELLATPEGLEHVERCAELGVRVLNDGDARRAELELLRRRIALERQRLRER